MTYQNKVLLLGATCLTALAAQAGIITDITPGGAVSFGGDQFSVFVAPSISWADAQTYVANNLPTGWHLATSTSASENAFIWGAIDGAWSSSGATPPPGEFWLGGYMPSSDPPHNWAWVTGEPWSYANWAPGEPNGDSGWTGNLAIGRYGDWGWNDEGAWPAGINGFVAEVPETQPMALLAGFGLLGLGVIRRIRA